VGPLLEKFARYECDFGQESSTSCLADSLERWIATLLCDVIPRGEQTAPRLGTRFPDRIFAAARELQREAA